MDLHSYTNIIYLELTHLNTYTLFLVFILICYKAVQPFNKQKKKIPQKVLW